MSIISRSIYTPTIHYRRRPGPGDHAVGQNAAHARAASGTESCQVNYAVIDEIVIFRPIRLSTMAAGFFRANEPATDEDRAPIRRQMDVNCPGEWRWKDGRTDTGVEMAICRHPHKWMNCQRFVNAPRCSMANRPPSSGGENEVGSEVAADGISGERLISAPFVC